LSKYYTSDIPEYMATKKKNVGGRPTVMTLAVIGKLEQVFSMDGTVLEACAYADISKDSYYDYVKLNPDFSDRVEALRQKPVLKARQTVMKNLSESYSNAMDYLSRKAKKEFSTRTEVTGAEGAPIISTLTDEEKEKLLKLIKPVKK